MISERLPFPTLDHCDHHMDEHVHRAYLIILLKLTYSRLRGAYPDAATNMISMLS